MATFPDKASRYIDWYLEAVEAAELTDKRYPVKGMNVWTPYGFQARRQLDHVLIQEIEKTGSRAVEFPLLIPETEFQKEKEHIKGFDAQVYWVTRGGTTPLDVPLVLRPTSETAMYPMFKLWVRSHRDLPLNVYQIVNTFRYETKTTRPFIRVREIHFFEEHTCQVDDAAATDRVRSNLEAFRRMADAFALPFVAVRRPDWDKFPGAYYSVALDIPVGGAQTLQIGTTHHYRQNFSRPYGIEFETVGGATEYVHQTTFGLSERLVGAVVSVHGDEKGVVFPSSLAPYQIAIVPIGAAAGAEKVGPYVAELAGRLRDLGVRVHVDDSDERPGAKYYRWETHGVPLRLEVGKREAEQGTVTIADRLGQKRSVGPNDRDAGIVAALADYDQRLRAKADAAFVSSFQLAKTLEDLGNSTKVRVVAWCGEEGCGHKIEQAIDGALLGTPEGPLPIDPGPVPGCVACGKSPARWALAGQQL